MRRWNGWGEIEQDHPLAAAPLRFLRERIGDGTPPADATRDDVLKAVAPSRLAGHAPFATDAASRLDHARGQSYPDWLALRHGRIGAVPDAVARPASTGEAQATLVAALAAGANVVPYGGGTSVVGHLAVPAGERPVLSLSLENLVGLQGFDAENRVARFGAGTPGPRVEAELARHGMLLGHFPQSYEYSTVGGWVVTRSSGQQSLRYGRIEQLFHGGTLLTPRGVLDIGGLPASSAGPDLREALMGSEGRLGVLTDVNLRVRPLPEAERFHAVFFADWTAGVAAARALAQGDLGLSMLRLSNETETETQLALAGHESVIALLRRYLRLRGIGATPVLMLLGVTGTRREVLRVQGDALALARKLGGVPAGTRIGAGWAKKRFHGPYLRNGLWAAGYGVDTVETCVPWSKATATMQAIERAARDTFAADGARVHAFTHLSHVYRQGCSVYATFVFRAHADHDRELARWRLLKSAVSEAIVGLGGTISHQHGVGTDHAPYLVREKGALGMDLIRAMARELDPEGRMNPGKLFA